MKEGSRRENEVSNEEFGENKGCIEMEDKVLNEFQYKKGYIKSS